MCYEDIHGLRGGKKTLEDRTISPDEIMRHEIIEISDMVV